jgi:hypothetical protein
MVQKRTTNGSQTGETPLPIRLSPFACRRVLIFVFFALFCSNWLPVAGWLEFVFLAPSRSSAVQTGSVLGFAI